MNTWVELCWQITSDCNENCKFCHFFPDKMNALSVDDNAMILKNISKCGIPAITWSGGEALLYIGLNELIRIARREGIKNRLITNGQICNIDIFQYLDELVISIDSIDPDCNAFLGRGSGHFDRALYTIQKTHDLCPLPIRINTMVSNHNIGHLAELYDFIIQNNIYKWRISKFSPLRGRAKENNKIFSISDADFDILLEKVRSWNINNRVIVETRQNVDFEHNYILIIPNGNIIVTKNNTDLVLGEAKNINILRKNTENINWLL